MQVQNHRKNSPIGGWTGGKTTLNRRFTTRLSSTK